MNKAIVTVAAAAVLAGCDAFTSSQVSEDEIRVEPNLIRLSEENGSAGTELVEIPAVFKKSGSDNADTAAIEGTAEIPYPIFPEAKQYRIGGENGLHIVLFETEASFSDVDAFYRHQVHKKGLSRISAMSDYVRYSANAEDIDAWATDKPGIVIHGFETEQEAKKYGAGATSQTNIIVSF